MIDKDYIKAVILTVFIILTGCQTAPIQPSISSKSKLEQCASACRFSNVSDYEGDDIVCKCSKGDKK